MMSTEDIKDLLYRKLKEVYYGIPVYKDRHPPNKKGKVPERIVVHMGTMSNTPWSMGYANINILVPCLESMGYKTPNNTRLNELQQIAERNFLSCYFEYGGNRGKYSIEDLSTEEDPDTDSYFVNVRLFIKVANFKMR